MYPKNLSVSHFIRYMCVPTFCYQHSYPSTDQIRPFYLLKRVLEGFLLFLFTSYLMSQHAMKIAETSLPYFMEWNTRKIIEKTLHMAVPAAYIWLGNFYLIFHTYLNFWAELTMFADRRFYSDWWNSSNLGEYWQKWNMPIHNFLLRHIYLPLRRLGISSSYCLLATFTFSAFFHEYVVVGIFSVVNGIAFTLMMVCVPIIAVQRAFKNRISGNTNNILFWLGYLVIGQPFGILYIHYQIHYQKH